ncbi:type-1 blue copper-containing cupredoxin [Candidatus Kuenenia stuttgartiensis]|jgi:plastocyanin|uniref:Type-1 blue copper-containing cupredoxin n=1 Tax=Kuenenia stuttgartiensis TaxID=174633 RepID=Q1PVE2_KUEST|nr:MULTISPECIES: hypothetical protein [Kuenenia]MBE7545650.1 hypothetical protein [Planctomycetia bacterium]MBZ0191977.1 hypothetical protein [Candidatus Kuenenia stuttgartiensis]MCF6152336.1 hypothetical protein [Candidatus Kuenenia stuttgartiensis]MCL4726774.1 hypothetical protein [Candidatus Kuenenia stuttgartiensis]MCZ7621685.1 hypothetical protein [Candidatus Kuenenia sp.]
MKQTLSLSLCIFAWFFYCTLFCSEEMLAGEHYTVVEVQDGGCITGYVIRGGDAGMPSIDLYAGWELPKSSQVISEKLEVNRVNNGVKNAIVSISNIVRGKKGIVPPIHPVIDQQRGVFVPRVTAILAGTTVDLLNGDEEMHNIHTKSMRNQPFNLGMSYKQRVLKKFDYPETIKLSCDIHHEYAWIVVFGHPYFDVTDRNGYFEICDIPEGTYVFRVWHEELGKREKEVMIRPRKTESIEIVYEQN